MARVLLIHLVHHGLGHHLQIFHVLAQRRHVNVKHIQPVKQIRAQMPMRHRILRIAIRRGQHAHIHVLLGARSQPAQFPLFQHAQQLGLRADRHLAQFIQQQRSALSASSKHPARRSTAPVNAPFSCPKISLSISVSGIAAQFTARNGRPLRGLRSCSVRATISLPVPLSPVIRTETFDGAICSISAKISRIAFELPTIVPKNARIPQLPPRYFQLNIRSPLPRCIGQDRPQSRSVYRLLQKVIRAQLHRIHCQLNRPLRRQQHHGNIGISVFRQFGQQPEAIHARHLQIRHHNRRIPGERLLPALDAIPRRLRLVSPAGDQLRQPHQGMGFVLDN